MQFSAIIRLVPLLIPFFYPEGALNEVPESNMLINFADYSFHVKLYAVHQYKDNLQQTIQTLRKISYFLLMF